MMKVHKNTWQKTSIEKKEHWENWRKVGANTEKNEWFKMTEWSGISIGKKVQLPTGDIRKIVRAEVKRMFNLNSIDCFIVCFERVLHGTRRWNVIIFCSSWIVTNIRVKIIRQWQKIYRSYVAILVFPLFIS